MSEIFSENNILIIRLSVQTREGDDLQKELLRITDDLTESRQIVDNTKAQAEKFESDLKERDQELSSAQRQCDSLNNDLQERVRDIGLGFSARLFHNLPATLEMRTFAA